MITKEDLANAILELKKAQQKTDEQLKKTDEQLRKSELELRNLFKKVDERLDKVAKQLGDVNADANKKIKESEVELKDLFKKVDERLDKVAKQLGGVTNNQGDVAEEYFINSLKDKLKIGKIDFDYLIPNYIVEGKNIDDEFDILLVNGKSVAIVEVKYKVHPNDVAKLSKKIKNLKKLPQYKDYEVYAGVAGFKIPKDVINLALKNGYFVLQRKGDVIQTFDKGLKAA